MADTASFSTAPNRSRTLWYSLAAAVLLALLGGGAWLIWGADPNREINAAIDRRDFIGANALLSKRVEEHPHDADLRLLAARTARRGGDFQLAAKHLSLYPTRSRPNAEHDLEHSLLNAQQGRRDEIERLFTEYIAKPDSPNAAFVMEACITGAMSVLMSDPSKLIDPDSGNLSIVARLHTAIDFWLRARPGRADRAEGLFWKGRLYHYSREHAKSLTTLREALKLDPDHIQARLDLAYHLWNESPEESLMHIELLRERHPENLKIKQHLAASYRMLGRAAEARRLLEELMAVDSQDVPTLVELGLLNLDEGKLNAAEPLLQRAYELAPNQADTNLAQCRHRQLAGKLDESEKYRKQFEEIEAMRRRSSTAP